MSVREFSLVYIGILTKAVFFFFFVFLKRACPYPVVVDQVLSVTPTVFPCLCSLLVKYFQLDFILQISTNIIIVGH